MQLGSITQPNQGYSVWWLNGGTVVDGNDTKFNDLRDEVDGCSPDIKHHKPYKVDPLSLINGVMTP